MVGEQSESSFEQRSGESEAIVIIKAAPQVSQRHGETVCCAGLDLHGRWLRMFPVSFRSLDDGQKFGRWDRVRFRWRRPHDDDRPESRRIDQDSLVVVGELKSAERQRFLAKSIVTSLSQEREAGRSLALLKPKIKSFKVAKRSEIDIQEDLNRFAELRRQADMFNTKVMIPYEPCPYVFKYQYECDDGEREGTCQDWEIEATYFRWSRKYGEAHALREMQKVFGEEYPAKGMLLAMGTHSRWRENWLINGVIRLDEIDQLSLF